MKRIAAIFDGLNTAIPTMDFAIRLCREKDAHLLGIFPESFLYHEYDFAQLLGKNGVSAVKIRHAVAREAEKRQQSVMHFEQACQREKISYSIVTPRGLTIDEVLNESTFAEMIIIDKHEQFNKASQQLPSTFLRQLLSDSRCPLLLMDEHSMVPKHLVLLYDGKPDSVYAIKLLFFLAIAGPEMSTELLYVSRDASQTAIPDAERLRALVECHRPGTVFTRINGEGKQDIADYVNGLGENVLAVAGAYGRGSTSRWFTPSVADKLISQCQCSLFVAHSH